MSTSTDAHATIDTERIAALEIRITDLEAEEERLKAAVATLEDENRWLGSILQQDERVREMRRLRSENQKLQAKTSVLIVYRTSGNYDSEENSCGNSFCLIGVFDDSQEAENAARRHEAEIETVTLNAEQCEWF